MFEPSLIGKMMLNIIRRSTFTVRSDMVSNQNESIDITHNLQKLWEDTNKQGSNLVMSIEIF